MPESKGRRLKVLQASVEDFEEGAADESGEGAGGLCAGVIREVKQRNRHCVADYTTALKYFQKTVRPSARHAATCIV